MTEPRIRATHLLVMNTDTPRTDSAIHKLDGHYGEWVPRYVSEELERELNSEVTLADELADAVKALRSVLHSLGASGNMGMTALTKHAVARRDSVLEEKYPRETTGPDK